MPPARRPLVAGNWKMNGLKAAIRELDAVVAGALGARAEVVVCPPATILCAFADRASGSAVAVGGQDCHPDAAGAHTGDLSAEMLADAGARFAIVGHSERRADHGEDDAAVRCKARAGHRAGLVAIVCVGETLGEREAGETAAVLRRQIAGSVPDGATAANTVIAYEPVWAIGTGKTPKIPEIADAHGVIRAALRARIGAEADGVRILYGGSVKPANAAEILALDGVDGALVGGASLKAADFLPIVRAA